MIPKSFLIFSNSIFFSHFWGRDQSFFFIIRIFRYFYDGRQAVTFMRQDIWNYVWKIAVWHMFDWTWHNHFRLLLLYDINKPIKCWFYGKFTNFPFISINGDMPMLYFFFFLGKIVSILLLWENWSQKTIHLQCRHSNI